MGERWSKERAWEWYNNRPWIRGCNFMGSDCANRFDQWQEYGFEERMETAEAELKLAAETGFNSIRIIPEFYIWKEQHDGFMQRFERYIETAYRYGISCMVVLGNDCMPPKEEALKRLKLGEQEWHLGYHGGRKVSQHSSFAGMGYHLLDEPELALEYYEFVRELVTVYKEDERIVIWDVYNEPGNSGRWDVTLPHMQKFFEIIREIDPIQPLTVAIHGGHRRLEDLYELERYSLENSDLISFHNYNDFQDMVVEIAMLKQYGRPILNTEWLARGFQNNVQEMFPLFFLEKIGCYNWGFVAGKYQTYEPWEGMWQRYEKDPNLQFDFTKWFHDLYRPSLRPYDPKEIEIIRKFADLADKEFAKRGLQDGK